MCMYVCMLAACILSLIVWYIFCFKENKNNHLLIFQMSAKVTAFGPAYFRSHRNKLDLLLSMITFVYLVFAVCSVISPSSISHINVSYYNYYIMLCDYRFCVFLLFQDLLLCTWSCYSQVINCTSKICEFELNQQTLM